MAHQQRPSSSASTGHLDGVDSRNNTSSTPSVSILCANNCGFYGTPENMNLCSRCYRQRRQAASTSTSARTEVLSDGTSKYSSANNIDIHRKPAPTSDDAMRRISKALYHGDDVIPQGRNIHRKAGNTAFTVSSEDNDDGDKGSALGTLDTAHDGIGKRGNIHAGIDVPIQLEGLSLPSTTAEQDSVGASCCSSSPPAPLLHHQPNRCAVCKKKVKLMGFKCRCGNLFCASHRHAEEHDCSYDYKAAARVSIAKNNSVVKASKLEKI